MENELKRDRKRQNIQNAIVGLLAISGVTAVSLVAPNILKTIVKIYKKYKPKKDFKYITKSALSKLIEKGLVKIIEKNGKKFVELTDSGKEKIKKHELSNYEFKKPKKWDKHWRVIIFDIKEYNRNKRDMLRSLIGRIGFVKLQNSVWVFPYDCEEVISLIKANYKLGIEVLYLIVRKLENDKPMLKHFGLFKQSKISRI